MSDVKPRLFYSSLCFQSLKLIGLCKLHGIELDLQEVALGDRAALSWSIYRTTPVLKYEDTVIEDWRAIIRYLAEFKDSSLVNNMNSEELSDFLDIVEQLDTSCFPLLIAPLFLNKELAERSIAKQIELRKLGDFQAFLFKLKWRKYVPRYLRVPANGSPETLFDRGKEILNEMRSKNVAGFARFEELITAMVDAVTAPVEKLPADSPSDSG